MCACILNSTCMYVCVGLWTWVRACVARARVQILMAIARARTQASCAGLHRARVHARKVACACVRMCATMSVSTPAATTRMGVYASAGAHVCAYKPCLRAHVVQHAWANLARGVFVFVRMHPCAVVAVLWWHKCAYLHVYLQHVCACMPGTARAQ